MLKTLFYSAETVFHRSRATPEVTAIGFRSIYASMISGSMISLSRVNGVLCVILLTFGASLAKSETPAPAGEVPSGSDSTQARPEEQSPDQSGTPGQPQASDAQESQPASPDSKLQPKRILGVMPNYRAVSAGAIPPPPTPKQAFKIATQNSFDYSAFIFVGITSVMAWGTDTHPQLRSGIAGYGRYYWRGFLDKADGNYLVIFALPTLLHEDERYYARGEGGIWKRGIYAASRVFITPNYHGQDTFNGAEIFGRVISQGVSAAYYPAGSRTAGDLAVKFGWAIGRDALTNVFREFWPDIATHVLHRHP
jgi:hypothetical protein